MAMKKQLIEYKYKAPAKNLKLKVASRVEVAMTGWAPLQRRILRPLDRGQVIGPEFRFLVLQETERQVVDGKVGVTLQVGQGVNLGTKGIHEQQRQRGVPVTPGGPHLPHDEVQEVQAIPHLEQVLGLVLRDRKSVV